MTILLNCSFVNHLIIVCRNEKLIKRLPIVISLLAVTVLICTNLGFPYSGQVDSLTPQRYLISVSEGKFEYLKVTVIKLMK